MPGPEPELAFPEPGLWLWARLRLVARRIGKRSGGVGVAQQPNATLLLAAATLILLAGSRAPARCAQLAGVTMPDQQLAAGARLELNGMALRTFSFLGIRIYVAGLYLGHRSSDPKAILALDEPELLRFVFLRDVGQGAARRSWRTSLDNACPTPCGVPEVLIDRFIRGVPAIHAGDVSTLQFVSGGVDIAMNGRLLGHVADPVFARVILSTFIGDHPTAPEVKRGLLGNSG